MQLEKHRLGSETDLVSNIGSIKLLVLTFEASYQNSLNLSFFT